MVDLRDDGVQAADFAQAVRLPRHGRDAIQADAQAHLLVRPPRRVSQDAPGIQCVGNGRGKCFLHGRDHGIELVQLRVREVIGGGVFAGGQVGHHAGHGEACRLDVAQHIGHFLGGKPQAGHAGVKFEVQAQAFGRRLPLGKGNPLLQKHLAPDDRL